MKNAPGIKLGNSPLRDDGDNVSADSRVDANTPALSGADVAQAFVGFQEDALLSSAEADVDGAGNAFTDPFLVNQTAQALAALAMSSLPAAGAASLPINDAADNVINSIKATAALTVSGLQVGAIGSVAFRDAADHQMADNVAGNGTHSADLSALKDGTIASLLSATDLNAASTSGNANSSDNDNRIVAEPIGQCRESC